MTEGESAPQTRAGARAQRDGAGAAEGTAAAPKRRFHWVRAASDRVPTTWFAGIATGALLVATAAFGGLATAAEPGPATIEPGSEHRNDQFALTIESAQLRDEDPDVGIYLDDGERMLTVRVRAENVWTQPQSPTDIGDNMTIDELPLKKLDSVRRVDDSTFVSRLQPNVPAEIEYRWVVGENDFHDGDALHVTLNDLNQYVGSFVMSGTWWDDPRPVAELTLTIVDDRMGVGS